MSNIWRYTEGTYEYVAPYRESLAIPRVGSEFYWRDSSIFVKGTSLVATDYFTKWTEAVPLKNMTHKEVINFVQEQIIY
jgi:hypothetical protein